MFEGFDMRDRCPNCGAPFEHDSGEFTGPLMFSMGFVGLVALFGAFFIGVIFQWPWWIAWAWAGWWAIGFPILFYRNLKGLWVGVVYAARGPDQPLGVTDDAEPRS